MTIDAASRDADPADAATRKLPEVTWNGSTSEIDIVSPSNCWTDSGARFGCLFPSELRLVPPPAAEARYFRTEIRVKRSGSCATDSPAILNVVAPGTASVPVEIVSLRGAAPVIRQDGGALTEATLVMTKFLQNLGFRESCLLRMSVTFNVPVSADGGPLSAE